MRQRWIRNGDHWHVVQRDSNRALFYVYCSLSMKCRTKWDVLSADQRRILWLSSGASLIYYLDRQEKVSQFQIVSLKKKV